MISNFKMVLMAGTMILDIIFIVVMIGKFRKVQGFWKCLFMGVLISIIVSYLSNLLTVIINANLTGVNNGWVQAFTTTLITVFLVLITYQFNFRIAKNAPAEPYSTILAFGYSVLPLLLIILSLFNMVQYAFAHNHQALESIVGSGLDLVAAQELVASIQKLSEFDILSLSISVLYFFVVLRSFYVMVYRGFKGQGSTKMTSYAVGLLFFGILMVNLTQFVMMNPMIFCLVAILFAILMEWLHQNDQKAHHEKA